ncbi:MAG: ATP-binding protein [Acidobacteriota bacterium]
MKKIEELPASKLRWKCELESIPEEIPEEISALEGIIGQDRAINAIKLGLEIENPGYNIFINGPVGTGRTTTIKKLLEKLGKKEERPNDLCYLNNFKNPDMPILISLPAGYGKELKKDMENLIDSLRTNIPAIFESELYQLKKKGIFERFEENQREILRNFEKKVVEKGFKLVQLRLGPFLKPAILPVVDGNTIEFEELENLTETGKFPKEKLEQIKESQGDLINEMEDILKQSKELTKELSKKMDELNDQAILPYLESLLNEIKDKYENQKLNQYFKDVKENIMKNLELFQEKEESSEDLKKVSAEDQFLKFSVNVVVDNSETKGSPIIIETSPSYKNLFGTIEREVDRKGILKADFTKIKAGSLLRANGGHLVLNATDMIMEPGVWPTLKRTLRNGVLEIQSVDPFYLISTSALKPEPIEIKVKVILIGNPYLYYLLYYYDEEFRKIFKIRADFDTVMKNTPENITQYNSFINMICKEENLLPFEKEAVAAVTEFGVKLAGRKNKLSTRFNVVADLIRESNYWAKKDGKQKVDAFSVEKAIEEWRKRVSLTEEKIQEMIEEGLIMIDTEGKVVGQVNGLSIFHLGEYTFGKPTRISARTSIGKTGVINIEREAELSGKAHNKGVLILAGYIKGKYAQDKPLAMDATLCFEQSYSEIDGDSASSTEVYAILSSLSGLPLRQDIAVTGSVNQKGEIQPIGGVNEKIEGFYKVCKAKGLTGTQGVIIPYQNVEDLMLNKEAVEAVEKRKFHVYPIKSIDEGIEILTGVEAGERKEDGSFPEGTVNYMVDKKLREFAEKIIELEKVRF